MQESSFGLHGTLLECFTDNVCLWLTEIFLWNSKCDLELTSDFFRRMSSHSETTLTTQKQKVDFDFATAFSRPDGRTSTNIPAIQKKFFAAAERLRKRVVH